eukprot:365043-Chlamydomonas_euryale.AAC.1
MHPYTQPYMTFPLTSTRFRKTHSSNGIVNPKTVICIGCSTAEDVLIGRAWQVQDGRWTDAVRLSPVSQIAAVTWSNGYSKERPKATTRLTARQMECKKCVG